MTNQKKKRGPPPKGSRPTPQRTSPAFVTPMAAQVVKGLPEGDDWIYELKFDGYRALIIKDEQRVELRSRKNKDLTGMYPLGVEVLKEMHLQSRKPPKGAPSPIPMPLANDGAQLVRRPSSRLPPTAFGRESCGKQCSLGNPPVKATARARPSLSEPLAILSTRHGGRQVPDRPTSPTNVRAWIGMLRERRVLRVMAVYLVGAWLALQVADVALLPAVGVPEVGMRYLVIAACLGLVIAFVLSWRYQITSQGIARHEFRIGESRVPATLNRSDRWVIAGLGGAALLVAGVTALKLADLAGDAQAETKTPVDAQPAPAGSLAVLPFANLSDDPKMDYLGDGLAEELLNRLARVPSLRVTARTSAFSFKGRADATVREIGRMPRRRSCLGRQCAAVGGRVADHGPARRYVKWLSRLVEHLRSYSRDVFAIQDDIAQTVLESLRVVLTPQAAKSSLHTARTIRRSSIFTCVRSISTNAWTYRGARRRNSSPSRSH